jgi:Flp pilus assembly protein TadG
MTLARLSRRGGHAGERGQNLLEFAVVVPVFAVLIFGIIEFGNLMRVQVELDNAVRGGARKASILSSSGSFTSSVEAAVTGAAPDLSGISFSPAPAYPTACPATTAEVTVTASYSYTGVTPLSTLVSLFSGHFPSPDTVSSSSTMHSECN